MLQLLSTINYHTIDKIKNSRHQNTVIEALDLNDTKKEKKIQYDTHKMSIYREIFLSFESEWILNERPCTDIYKIHNLYAKRCKSNTDCDCTILLYYQLMMPWIDKFIDKYIRY